MHFENNQAPILNIAVNHNFQGQGIGGTLMELAGLKAKERVVF